MYTITKEFTFDAAHRLLDYEGPCANLHGHTYLVIIEFKAAGLDHQGFVIDYTDVKHNCKGWVDKFWDHGAILNDKDKDLVSLLIFQKNKVYPMNCNPTAENMADHLFMKFDDIFPKDRNYNLSKVTVRETPTSSASYTT